MSDPARTDRDSSSPRRSSAASMSFLRRLAGQMLDGPARPESDSADRGAPGLKSLRIDPSHAAAHEAEPEEHSTRDDVAPAPRLPRREEEVLRQTSQIAAHLRNERLELDRREQAIHEQHALLDQEWRSARLWVHELEEELLKRQSECKAREDELTEKISACETLVSELEEQERLVLALRDQMSAERSSLRETVDRELETERLALQQTRRALEEERRALTEENERRRREHEESVRVQTARLEEERAALRGQLAVQLEAERASFERERAAWNAQRAAEEAELSNRRDLTAAATQRTQEELDALRRREFEQLRLERETLEARLTAERQTLEDERQKLELDRRRFTDELEELKKIQIEEIERERSRVRDEIEASRRELDEVRARIEDDLKRRVEERERGLREEQKKLEEQHREQLSRLEQERNRLENRLRFQQDHLQRARREVEAAQQELRWQHQADRVEIERREELARLRHAQLVHVRSLLEEREQSVSREHAILTERRRTLEQELAHRGELLARERSAWEEDRRQRDADLKRRETLRAAEADLLESRRERLDALRTELEETHRSTLEMRMAIEEVWAQLSEHAGTEATQRRLAEAQRLVGEHWQTVRDGLARERRELGELQAALNAQRVEVAADTEAALNAVDERLMELEREREKLAAESAALRRREDDFNALRQRWFDEKVEVEQIIRGLLVQLGSQAERASNPDSPPLGTTQAGTVDAGTAAEAAARTPDAA